MARSVVMMVIGSGVGLNGRQGYETAGGVGKGTLSVCMKVNQPSVGLVLGCKVELHSW